MKLSAFAIALCFVLVPVAKAEVWSNCSKTCGGGSKSRKICLWGNVCGRRYRECNTHPCIKGGWDTWQPCSKSCGGGTTFKVVWCPYLGLEFCPKAYADCNTDKCEALADCPSGHRFRYEDDTSCCKIVNGDCGVDVASSRKIVGGKNATQGKWPWVVAILKKKGGREVIQCGGSLLNERWVVTAAHCFEPSRKLYVLLGSVTIKNPELGYQRRTVEENITHPNYVKPYNDIGLVKMDADVTFTKHIRPICLPTGEITPIDKTCVVAGWGQIRYNDENYPNHLQQVKIRTLPLDACIQGFKTALSGDWEKLHGRQHICAGILAGGKDSCVNDSGGPLMCQRCSTCSWYIAGIVSVGPKMCGRTGVPAAYMNVYIYQYWIRQHVSLTNEKYFVC